MRSVTVTYHSVCDMPSRLFSDNSTSSSFIVCRFLLIVDSSAMIAFLNLSLHVALSTQHQKHSIQCLLEERRSLGYTGQQIYHNWQQKTIN